MATIAIVGAGPGLGLSIGKLFGQHGFNVALVSRRQSKVVDLARELTVAGVDAVGIVADVMDPPSLVDAFTEIRHRYGSVEVLEYSPAPHDPVPGVESVGALEATATNVQPQIEFYLYGAMAAVDQVLPGMIAAGSGTLIFTTGGSSVNARPWIANVGIGGAALRSWVQSLRLALEKAGVYACHVPIGTWIGREGPDSEPDTIAQAYWDLYINRDAATREYGWWDREPLPGATAST